MKLRLAASRATSTTHANYILQFTFDGIKNFATSQVHLKINQLFSQKENKQRITFRSKYLLSAVIHELLLINANLEKISKEITLKLLPNNLLSVTEDCGEDHKLSQVNGQQDALLV